MHVCLREENTGICCMMAKEVMKAEMCGEREGLIDREVFECLVKEKYSFSELFCLFHTTLP